MKKMQTLIILAICCGCTRTIYTPIETRHYHTDSVEVKALRIDTILQRDSVFVSVRGDTTTIVKFRDRYRVKEIHDTITKAVERVDTVSVPYPIEKPLSKWERVKMDFGGLAFGGVAVLLAFVIIWLVKSFRR